MHDAVAYLIYFPLIPLSIALPSFPFRFALSPELSIHPSLSPPCIFMSLAGNTAEGMHLTLCVCVCVKHFFLANSGVVGLFLDSKYIPSVVCT